MRTTNRTLVILGASLTGLAVARNARQNLIHPIVVDTRHGIAERSGFVEAVIRESAADEEIVGLLTELAKNSRNYLIATSDDWVRFLIRQRSVLEAHYSRILQASNEVLRICTNKLALSDWCRENAVTIPKSYRLESISEATNSDVEFPVLIRPAESAKRGDGPMLPKAVEVKNLEALKYWLNEYDHAGVRPVVTQSLLGQELTQYSVGIARSEEGMVSFVAKKVRPIPEDCAVGSYVELCPNNEIEAIARTIAARLDYYGVAELEILRSENNGCNYLIEINARPWIQYSLATTSGYDFLRFLLDRQSYYHGNELKTGKRWINFEDDLYNCFSRSVGVVRNGKLSFGRYLTSILRANVYAKLNLRDWGPFWYGLGKSVRMIR